MICSKLLYGDKINMESDTLTYIQIPDDGLSSNFQTAIILKNTSESSRVASNIEKGLNTNFSE